jgi:acyl-CoA thioester hydrolase
MRIEISREKKYVHQMNIRIRWGDMDTYGLINNPIFLPYIEQARVVRSASLSSNQLY